MQKFIGFSITLLANGLSYSLTNDWRILALGIVIGTSGVIYGHADT